MTERKPGATAAFEEALRQRDTAHYVLRLYVTRLTPRSTRAIDNIRTICERHLAGRYELEVIDIRQRPELARAEQIVAVPTLIKELPPPLRRLVGDLSDTERVLVHLDVLPSPAPRGPE